MTDTKISSIEEIRARLLKEQAGNAQAGGNSFGVSAVYPFWNIPDKSTAVVRFLPDADNGNPFFWKERHVINLPFTTVEGHPEATNVEVTVPSMRMYGKGRKCPIVEDTRNLWNTDEALARVYWPKKSFLYQGFVVSSELEEAEIPENGIRRFVINPSIHRIVSAAMIDPDMDANPCDYTNGYDFRITRNKGTGYADYTTSAFARRSRPLDEAELVAIDTHGLFNLVEYIPREPDQEALDVIMEMYLESRKPDSVFRQEWAQYYTPKGVNMNTSQQSQEAPAQTTQAPPQQAAPVEEAVNEPTPQQSSPEESNVSSDDAIAALRARLQEQRS